MLCCYAVCGTELGYAATRRSVPSSPSDSQPPTLSCYAVFLVRALHDECCKLQLHDALDQATKVAYTCPRV
eukprot:351257-Rhodomonas_salina.2